METRETDPELDLALDDPEPDPASPDPDPWPNFGSVVEQAGSFCGSFARALELTEIPGKSLDPWEHVVRARGELTMRQLYARGIPSGIRENPVPPNRHGIRFDPACKVCGAPTVASGHPGPAAWCPDVLIYVNAYANDGLSIREVADKYETDYSHVRKWLLEAGVELAGRGRRRKDQ